MNEGYGFTPLPESPRRVRRPEVTLARRMPDTWHGVLELTFQAEQPIHIGAGCKILVDAQVLRAGVVVEGRPGIPGASLKGVLRARYEAITKSCVSLCDPTQLIKDQSPQWGGYRRSPWQTTTDSHFKACSIDHELQLCPACALFGCMSLRSRVAISDLKSPEGTRFVRGQMPQQFSPNPATVFKPGERADSIVQLKASMLKGRKFSLGHARLPEMPVFLPVQVIPPATTLTGSVRVSNLTSSELGGLLVALGVTPPGQLKIGGGKGHGFGRIRLLSVNVERLQFAAKEKQPFDAEQLHQAFLDSSDCWRSGAASLHQLHDHTC